MKIISRLKIIVNHLLKKAAVIYNIKNVISGKQSFWNQSWSCLSSWAWLGRAHVLFHIHFSPPQYFIIKFNLNFIFYNILSISSEKETSVFRTNLQPFNSWANSQLDFKFVLKTESICRLYTLYSNFYDPYIALHPNL